jgi:hypothetical protein
MIPVFDGNRKNLLELVSKMVYHVFVNQRILSLVSVLESLTKHTLKKGGIHMPKEKKLTVGNRNNSKAFLDDLSTYVDVPSDIKVVDTNSGIINEGRENQLFWASLTCVDKKIYEQFASIAQESYCPTFKVKLKNYQNENLDGLINADIVISKYELSFVLDKLKQPIGLALVTELADISLK